MTPSHTTECRCEEPCQEWLENNGLRGPGAEPIPCGLTGVRFCVNCGRPTDPPKTAAGCHDCGHVLCEKCCVEGRSTSGPIFTSVRRRSKASQIPDSVPVAKVTLRQLFARAAMGKALKAFKRHGEKSYQFIKAMRSRWLVKE